MAYLLHYAVALLAAGWFVWLPGWWLERRVLETPISGGRRFLARWCLGLGVWIATLFTFAALGLYSALPIAIAVAGWHVLAMHETWRHGLARPLLGLSRRRFSPSFVLAACILGPLFGLVSNPTVSWDASVYHLTLPKLYLANGGFRDVPMNVYSHWPLGIELLFGAAMSLDTYVLAKVIHFGFGLLVLTALGRLVHGQARWLAIALFALNGVVLFEFRSAYVDLAHAFALLAGAVLVSWAADSEGTEHRRAAFLAGVAGGLLASVKVTGIASAAILGLLLLPSWLREASLFGVRRSLRSALFFVLPVLALWLPWVIRAWMLTGNPFYPWFWSYFGGPDWSTDLSRQLSEWQRSIGMGREALDYVLLPLRVPLLGGRGYAHFDGQIAAFWLLAAPAALWFALWSARWSSRRLGLWRHLVLVAGLSAVFWALTSQQMRFLIPVLALLAAPAAVAARQLTRRWLLAKPARRRLVAVSMITLFAGWAIAEQGRVLGAGARNLALYLRPDFDPLAVSPAPAIFRQMTALEEDAVVLFLNTNQGFFCPREYLADSFFEASQISSWLSAASTPGEVRALLIDRGVSHILLDRKNRGVGYPQPLIDLISDQNAVQQIADDGRFLLWALR